MFHDPHEIFALWKGTDPPDVLVRRRIAPSLTTSKANANKAELAGPRSETEPESPRALFINIPHHLVSGLAIFVRMFAWNAPSAYT